MGTPVIFVSSGTDIAFYWSKEFVLIVGE